MPPPGQIPDLQQIGWRLGGALDGIRQTRVVTVVPQSPQVQDILHAAHPFMPQHEWAYAQGLLNSGRIQDAFQAVARFESQIRQGYEQYLGEGAMQSMGLTWDQVRARPWNGVSVSPELVRVFESFRQLAGQKLNLDEVEERAVTTRVAQDDAPSQPGKTEIQAYGKYANHDPGSGHLSSQAQKWSEDLCQHLEREGFGFSYGYWKFGGALPSKQVQGRFYLSLQGGDHRHIANIWRQIQSCLNEGAKAQKIAVQYKMTLFEEGFQRFDSAVVYFRAQDERVVYNLLAKMHGEHPELFKAGTPAFTMPLSDADGRILEGLSFGQDPGPYVSFGEHRAGLLTNAIRIARLMVRNGLFVDWDELCKIFSFCLGKGGVDVANPAFEDQGRKGFPFLASLPLNPKPAARALPRPAPLPPAVPAQTPPAPPALGLIRFLQRVVVSKKQVEPEKLKDDIREELLERYAYLSEKASPEFLEALVRNFLRRMEREGLPELKEEAFERIGGYVGEYLAALESGADANTKALGEAIRSSDRGHREVRRIADEICANIPSFKNRMFGTLLKIVSQAAFVGWNQAGRPEGVMKTAMIRAVLKRSVLPQWEGKPAAEPHLMAIVRELKAFLS